MSDDSTLVTQGRNDFGRIEVVPEILVSIAERNTLNATGVTSLAEAPNARRNNRKVGSSGIVLTVEPDSVFFDIYVMMDANVNIMEASRALQVAVVEGIDRMVGVPVTAVNVHVEDVVYPAQ